MRQVFAPVVIKDGKLATVLKASMVNVSHSPEEITLEPDNKPFTTNRGVGFQDLATAMKIAQKGQTVVLVEAEELIPVAELVSGFEALGVINGKVTGIFLGHVNPVELGKVVVIYGIPVLSPDSRTKV